MDNFEKATLFIQVLSLLGIVFIFLQYRAFCNWNLKQSMHTIGNDVPTTDIENSVIDVLKKYQLGFYDCIDQENCDSILLNDSDTVAIKNFLNKYETILMAISNGCLDVDYAYNALSARTNSLWERYKYFCLALREKQNDNHIYIEIEQWTLFWNSYGSPSFKDKIFQSLYIKKAKQHLLNGSIQSLYWYDSRKPFLISLIIALTIYGYFK